MTRIRAFLLRKLLRIHTDTDVAIVSVVGGAPVITHGIAQGDVQNTAQRWVAIVCPTWVPSERVH